MPIAAVNGTRLYYEINGASGIPVVLVHGSWGDHHNWDAVIPELSRAFRVLTFDRRGHSQSPRETGHGTQLDDAMDLAALIEHLDFAPAHIVGNSFGAAVTLRLACERHDVFRSLTVHEPPLFGLLAGEPMFQDALAAMEARVGAAADLLKSGDMAGGARLFVDTIAFGAGGWDKLPEAARQTFVNNAWTWLDELQDPAWSTLDLQRLARYSKPAFVSRGDRSAPFFPAVVVQIARALPHAHQHLFTGAGHVPHLEQPADYVREVSRFISGVEQSRHITAAEMVPRPTASA